MDVDGATRGTEVFRTLVERASLYPRPPVGSLVKVTVLRVRKNGIVALPEDLRRKAGIKEGTHLLVEACEDRIVLKPLHLWEKVRGSGKGLGSVEEADRELDAEDAQLGEDRGTLHAHAAP